MEEILNLHTDECDILSDFNEIHREEDKILCSVETFQSEN